jgi:hypothetical protein
VSQAGLTSLNVRTSSLTAADRSSCSTDMKLPRNSWFSLSRD